jgi:hypothetical protein
MKNAYQRRRVKARVEKRARMMKLDAITLDFARQVIEEETGTPLEIGVSAASGPAFAPASVQGASARQAGAAVTGTATDGESRLIARDDKKNPLISTFEWTDEAVQRIFRVPAGFMRNKTQERVEELARERAAACRAEASGEGGTIDLTLVEDGIEIGKKMMAEMIATYSAPAASPAVAKAPQAGSPAPKVVPAGNGSGYLNEVSPLSARGPSSES